MRVSTYFVVGIMIASSTVVFAADVQSRPGEKTEDRAVARQCLKDLQAFDEKLAETGFGFLPPGGYGSTARSGYYVWGVEETPRQKIRSLHNAAYVYARGGDEQSCQMVLASMRQVYEQHQKPVGIEADDPNVRLAWRRAHLSRAKPITEMDHLVRADVLIGSQIRNLQDEKLGQIEDLVLNPDSVVPVALGQLIKTPAVQRYFGPAGPRHTLPPAVRS